MILERKKCFPTLPQLCSWEIGGKHHSNIKMRTFVESTTPSFPLAYIGKVPNRTERRKIKVKELKVAMMAVKADLDWWVKQKFQSQK
jgi:hypothetical protein